MPICTIGFRTRSGKIAPPLVDCRGDSTSLWFFLVCVVGGGGVGLGEFTVPVRELKSLRLEMEFTRFDYGGGTVLLIDGV